MIRIITGLIILLVIASPLAAQNIFPSTGSVGIGTTSPQTLLHVSGTNDVPAFIENTGDGYASLILKSHNKKFMWSKRPASESDVLALYYNDGTNWMTPEYMNIQTNGNIGIGTNAPRAKLDVNGGAWISQGIIADQLVVGGASGWFRGAAGGNSNVIIQGNAGNYAAFWITSGPQWLKIGGSGGTEPSLGAINVNDAGNVGIGTMNFNDATYKLFVETGIRTRKIKVDQSSWPDYVFDDHYTLRPLSEIEKFIQQHKHLPEVPSAVEVKDNGVNLGDNQALLLKKIEELTLYLVAQDKTLKKQQAEIDQLKKQLKRK
jgi:hypothetical protein